MMEALLWLLAAEGLPPRARVLFVVDSSYVHNILTDRCVPRHNVVISAVMRHLWNRAGAKFSLDISWVKSHSGVFGNERADQLANAGDTAEPFEFRIRERAFDTHEHIDDDFYSLLNTFPMTAEELLHHRRGPQRRTSL